MPGANTIHTYLRKELTNYIKSQYFGKSPILLEAVGDNLDREGVLYQKPFIESSPAYKSISNGIQGTNLPEWLKSYFLKLSDVNLGVFPSPYVHQVEALKAFVEGKDLFISTGTGSGKTECFMWPMLAKLAMEAKTSPETWEKRSVRTIIMYPMNALVSDQVSRLRKLIGDTDNKFVSIFRDTCGHYARRPQFGMYTGRTPYPGENPRLKDDRELEKQLREMVSPKEEEKSFFEAMAKEGKIPAKEDMETFLENLHNGRHIPSPEDAELITRFEMQKLCPDILITNYSMLEYMILRPQEKIIWEETKAWLNENKNNKLLFVIDEAHMYRGSAGGEVALLIRRLLHRLGINRDRVQFILTTASMPDSSIEDKEAVMAFANALTAADNDISFCYLTGEEESIAGSQKYDIEFSKFTGQKIADFESQGQLQLDALNAFWVGIEGCPAPFSDLSSASEWMFDHLIEYRPFFELINNCRGDAKSLQELASIIFANYKVEEALNAISLLLAIAPLAKDKNGVVLFPARMHMLFRGINGVYACANEKCSHSHGDGTLTLGEIFISDGCFVCPHCGSMVYELYNDRRCGALFFKGYVLEQEDVESLHGNIFFWRYPGYLMDKRMKELHLYIPEKNYENKKTKGKNAVFPCYLDVKSGFINFDDDKLDGKPGIRKLYYSNYRAKGRPETITFSTCPHCEHQLSSTQLTSFSTRGNQSFFNLIKAQFQSQPAVPGKDKDPILLPNEGRKVLLFSDSRQRAARLARDMSDSSDISVARQLFVLAILQMEESTQERSMNDLYDYFCLVAGQRHVQIFHDAEREKFIGDCNSALRNFNRCAKRNRDYSPKFSMVNSPQKMQEFFLRLFAGGYNTLYDSAISWIEPTSDAMDDAEDYLEEMGIDVSDEEFQEVFNAWMMSVVCDKGTALGHIIKDEIREFVRKKYGGYGLEKQWDFSKNIKGIMSWDNNKEEAEKWKLALEDVFLDAAQPDNGRLYVDLSQIKPRLNLEHTWHKCMKCSELTPYLLKGKCPICGSESVKEMDAKDYDALMFWRKPIDEAINGARIHVIDTEEHTAQISYKDQRDELWSKTENYELRFQDLIRDGETPVDILSSTTTMEVGIDIGSLVAIGLRNIPPMRENYQQRAGRAGRRGASLSTIVTFCEDGPHDTLYFNNPVPMFRGDPRRPWIDIGSEKLLQRHLGMIVLQDFLNEHELSLDRVAAVVFLDDLLIEFLEYLHAYIIPDDILLPKGHTLSNEKLYEYLQEELIKLKNKRDNHPELYGTEIEVERNGAKSLLDALYEEGIIPTYSFPKNVVSTYIVDSEGKTKFEVDRGLDIAISEYAPGRTLVIDKKSYQIGGLYYPGSEKIKGHASSPARRFIDDGNYLKKIVSCSECGWFGFAENDFDSCPFCGSKISGENISMLKPWGFAPKNAESIPDAQIEDMYSYAQQPLYSTLPDADEMEFISGYKNIRMAERKNQNIIMVNSGPSNKGFMICKDCGAAMPGDDPIVLKGISRPYKSNFAKGKCGHYNTINVNLGYDFVTDMLVLEFALDSNKIDTNSRNGLWLERASQSLAEAIRLVLCKKLDIEFTELITGWRYRKNLKGAFVDIFLYDSLSSGAGYAVSISDDIKEILNEAKALLTDCDCENACHKCLKHYRNQFVHGQLDRFEALELLEWGQEGTLAASIDIEEQRKQLESLKYILKTSDIEILDKKDRMVVKKGDRSQDVIIYPAMWREPYKKNSIYLSDALLKYAKPYAVQKILESI